jgi:hypothetical protein
LDSAYAEKAKKLACAVRPILDQKWLHIEELKQKQTHWETPEFIWEALLASFST